MLNKHNSLTYTARDLVCGRGGLMVSVVEGAVEEGVADYNRPPSIMVLRWS